RLGALADGGFHNLRHELRAPENVHDVDWLRNRFHIGVTLFAQDFGLMGVDRDDPIPGPLHVFRYAITGTVALGGEAHHGYGPANPQDFGNLLHTASCWMARAAARFNFCASSSVKYRNWPGFREPSSMGPMRTRRNFSTRNPKCLNISRIWLLRPSKSRTSYHGFSAWWTTRRPAGMVRRPESGTPSRNCCSCGPVSEPFTFTT